MKFFFTRIGTGLLVLTIFAAIITGIVIQPWWLEYVVYGAIILLVSFVIGVMVLDT